MGSTFPQLRWGAQAQYHDREALSLWSLCTLQCHPILSQSESLWDSLWAEFQSLNCSILAVLLTKLQESGQAVVRPLPIYSNLP
mmetsp:Transcript_15399/g.33890  ORF Transcript_15399/g.33890 Transcript_15399/m.33890 type:complete len:84 (+) Transcript_15399:726-977(+)